MVVLLEDATLVLATERKRLEYYVIGEYQAVGRELEGKTADARDGLLPRIESAIDLCAHAGLNTMLVTFASLKEEIVHYHGNVTRP